jgi:hypothetical protein
VTLDAPSFCTLCTVAGITLAELSYRDLAAAAISPSRPALLPATSSPPGDLNKVRIHRQQYIGVGKKLSLPVTEKLTCLRRNGFFDYCWCTSVTEGALSLKIWSAPESKLNLTRTISFIRGGGSSSPGRLKNFYFSISSKSALGSTQSPTNGYRGSFPRLKRQGREADHSSPTSAEVKKMRIYTSTPITENKFTLIKTQVSAPPVD